MSHLTFKMNHLTFKTANYSKMISIALPNNQAPKLYPNTVLKLLQTLYGQGGVDKWRGRLQMRKLGKNNG